MLKVKPYTQKDRQLRLIEQNNDVLMNKTKFTIKPSQVVLINK